MNLRTRIATLLALALASSVAAPARADVRPVSAKEDVARLPAPWVQLYADTTLFPQPTQWRDAIPWVLDLDAVIRLLDGWKPPPLDRSARARLAFAAARACGLQRPPRIPQAELPPRGRRHSPERDARAVRHHYDLPSDFFALFLDRSMTYSCGLFSRGATTQ